MAVQRYFGFVSGNKYYHIQNYPTNRIRIIIYDNSVPEITYSTDTLDEAIYTIPSDENLFGIAYDGSNTIYFVIKKDADSKYYLVSYNISGDAFTVHSEFNVALMLDRNVLGSNPPFTLEKGFHLTANKVYQIPATYTGKLNWFSHSLPSDETIKAITDHFVFTE